MSLLDQRFKELRERLDLGRPINSYGTEPVFYLVFPPAEILDVKARMPVWKAQLTNSGWEVAELSLGRMVHEYLERNESYAVVRDSEPMLRDGLIAADLPEHQAQLAISLQGIVLQDGKPQAALMRPLLEAVVTNNSRQRGLLILTDVEALHPLLRINTIENQLLGQVKQPIVVLYPGRRHGQTSLSFLGFYPADPNYRSEHIG